MGGTSARRTIRVFASLWALLMVVGAAAVSAPAPLEARSRYRVATARVRPGVRMQRIYDRRGPNRIRVLRVDPQGSPVIDVALANNVLPGHETTSAMARRHGAVAAINGDFTLRPSDNGAGRPVNAFAEDGLLKTSPLIWGRNFSISRDEQDIRIRHNRLHTWLTQTDTGESWNLAAVNPVVPDQDGFSVWTRAGQDDFKPPRDSCAARLRPDGTNVWTPTMDGLTRNYYVHRIVCRWRPLARRGGVVVTAPWGSANGALMQASLLEGETVTYGWSLRRVGIMDTIGGNPTLLENGRYSIGECSSSYFCGRNPRTGVGVTANGTVLLVTVDGRRPGYSRGMTLREFADLFRYLGATDALNLDGGGSTTMVVNGRIVNRPSGGYERAVGSALLVLAETDSDEIEPAPYPTPTPTETFSPTPTVTPTATLPPVTSPVVDIADEADRFLDPSCQVLLDPGSTGGLLDALSHGDFTPRRARFSPHLRWALNVFEGDAICPDR
ncbi:MAG: phosphodiester glycosidase family protein [Actinomycetota bacterium]